MCNIIFTSEAKKDSCRGNGCLRTESPESVLIFNAQDRKFAKLYILKDGPGSKKINMLCSFAGDNSKSQPE